MLLGDNVDGRGLCEWDPDRGRPAEGVPLKFRHYDSYNGCPNHAELIVGALGLWRLCAGCAGLPAFRRLRKRVPIRPVADSA